MFRLLCLLVFSAAACANVQNDIPAISENEPSVYVEGIVNALTGDLCHSSIDIVAQGAEPIPIRRSYITGRNKTGIGMNMGPLHLYLTYQPGIMVLAYDSNGSLLTFKPVDPKALDFFAVNPADALGLSNTSRGIISAHTNLSNFRAQRLSQKEIVIHASNGSSRHYRLYIQPNPLAPIHSLSYPQSYCLFAEKLPNGHWFLYEYDQHTRVKSIRSTDASKKSVFASVRFDYQDNRCDVHMSDGRAVSYLYTHHSRKEKHHYTRQWWRLQKVSSSYFPEITFDHHTPQAPELALLNSMSLPNRHAIAFSYANDRVETISAPVGHDATLHDTPF